MFTIDLSLVLSIAHNITETINLRQYCIISVQDICYRETLPFDSYRQDVLFHFTLQQRMTFIRKWI